MTGATDGKRGCGVKVVADLLRRAEPETRTLTRRWLRSLGFRSDFERRRWVVLHPEVETFKATHAATVPLNVMAFPHMVDRFHHGGQVAQKRRLAHRRQLTGLYYLLKKVPHLFAR